MEGLVKSLRAWAAATGLSGVVLAAVVLGLDLESTAAGVAATLDGLPGTALGTSIGAAIFLMTAGLGIAGLIAPFAVRPPTALLGAGAAATALAIALSPDGRLTRLDGAALLVCFAPLVAAILHGRADGVPAPPEGGERPSRPWLRVAAGVAGLVVGAELLVLGTERVVAELGVSETVFGLLVIAAAVSFEEVVLEALPAFRGFPELRRGQRAGHAHLPAHRVAGHDRPRAARGGPRRGGALPPPGAGRHGVPGRRSAGPRSPRPARWCTCSCSPTSPTSPGLL